jgi:hypothetical protein
MTGYFLSIAYSLGDLSFGSFLFDLPIKSNLRIEKHLINPRLLTITAGNPITKVPIFNVSFGETKNATIRIEDEMIKDNEKININLKI